MTDILTVFGYALALSAGVTIGCGAPSFVCFLICDWLDRREQREH